MQDSNITQIGDGSSSDPALTPTEPNSQKSEGWRSIISTVVILIAAPLIAWFIIAFVFQSYEVDGPSMESTLQDNDRLIVLKTGKTWAKMTGNKYIPKRGDIVVFEKDGLFDINGNGKKQLIKRVVALPGERVIVRDGQLTVINEANPEGFQPDKVGGYLDPGQVTQGTVDYTVPEGEVYVCGDNREKSLDSRNFGSISSENIIGSLALRIFPLNKIENY